jgi:hypothetical protein
VQLQQHAAYSAALKSRGDSLAIQLSETENKLKLSVAEIAGVRTALAELQATGVNKEAAIGEALKALELLWTQQAQSLQEACPHPLTQHFRC